MLYLGTSAFLVPGWAGSLRYVELPGKERFDLYSQEFNACELSLPHHLPLQPALELSALRRCRPGFQFTVKAPPAMTLRCPGDEPLLAAFIKAMEPLQREHRLGCVLAPLPAYFEYSQRHRDYLLLLQERLGGTSLAVEFHNPSWFRREALAWLHWHRLSLCWADSAPLPAAPLLRATGGMGYIRLRVGAPCPTSPAGDAFQISHWLPHIRDLAACSEKTFVLAVSALPGRALEFLRKLRTVLVGSNVACPQGVGLLSAGSGGTRR